MIGVLVDVRDDRAVQSGLARLIGHVGIGAILNEQVGDVVLLTVRGEIERRVTAKENDRRGAMQGTQRTQWRIVCSDWRRAREESWSFQMNLQTTVEVGRKEGKGSLPLPAAMINGVTLYFVPVQSMKSIWSSMTPSYSSTSARLRNGRRWNAWRNVCERERVRALVAEASNLRRAAPACLGRRWSTAAGASVDRLPDAPWCESEI